MHLRNIPYVRLLLPFAAGIAASELVTAPCQWLPAATMATAALLLAMAPWRTHYRFRWIFGFTLSSFLFLAGYARAHWYDERQQPEHFALVPHIRYVTGTVCDLPSSGKRLKIPVLVQAVADSNGIWRPCSGRILFCIKPDSTQLDLRYGDRLLVCGKPVPAEGPQNPHAFDYRRYLHFQNLHYQVFADAGALRLLNRGHGSRFWRTVYSARSALLRILERHFPGADEYAVAAALLVGDKDDLSESLRDAYARTGSMHALAVSGTHVGFLYSGLMLLLERIPLRGKRGYRLKALLILLAIWAFTGITGATASVVRASVMFSFYLLGKAIQRDASVWNTLAASAFALLLSNPFFLFDAGCQLSYAAVAGMVIFYPNLYRRLPPMPRLPDEGIKVLLVGVAAQIGTLPLSLYYFHQFPIYFWLSGWVVVLGGAIFLWGGALLVLLDPFGGWAAEKLGEGLYLLVRSMNYLVEQISRLPFSVLEGIWLPWQGVVVLYAAIACAAIALEWKKARWWLYALMLIVVLEAGLSIRAFQLSRERRLCVYHLKEGYLIDCFERLHCNTLESPNLPASHIKRTALANRWAQGVTVADTSQAFIQPPFMGINGLRLVLLNESVQISGHKPGPPIDILIVAGNPRLDFREAVRLFPCKKIVLTAAVRRRNLLRWKKIAAETGIPVHAVGESGAFEYPF